MLGKKKDEVKVDNTADAITPDAAPDGAAPAGETGDQPPVEQPNAEQPKADQPDTKADAVAAPEVSPVIEVNTAQDVDVDLKFPCKFYCQKWWDLPQGPQKVPKHIKAILKERGALKAV